MDDTSEASELQKIYEAANDVLRRLQDMPRSREVSLAITNIEQGTLWLARRQHIVAAPPAAGE